MSQAIGARGYATGIPFFTAGRRSSIGLNVTHVTRRKCLSEHAVDARRSSRMAHLGYGSHVDVMDQRVAKRNASALIVYTHQRFGQGALSRILVFCHTPRPFHA